MPGLFLRIPQPQRLSARDRDDCGRLPSFQPIQVRGPHLKCRALLGVVFVQVVNRMNALLTVTNHKFGYYVARDETR